MFLYRLTARSKNPFDRHRDRHVMYFEWPYCISPPRSVFRIKLYIMPTAATWSASTNRRGRRHWTWRWSRYVACRTAGGDLRCEIPTLYRGIPSAPLVAQNVSTRNTATREHCSISRTRESTYIYLKGKYFSPSYVNFQHLYQHHPFKVSFFILWLSKEIIVSFTQPINILIIQNVFDRMLLNIVFKWVNRPTMDAITCTWGINSRTNTSNYLISTSHHLVACIDMTPRKRRRNNSPFFLLRQRTWYRVLS